MRGELVALDLETTGLDIMNDAIIEVGAVRMKDGQIIDEFSAMVNPDRPIPSQITHITGITDDDVINAQAIDQVLPQITAFVRDTPVIAHNIFLDMGFLQDHHNILTKNQRIDTYDLAAILLPTAPRYTLSSLTTQVGIELEHAHRALDDARATALLYWELWKKALTLPADILAEINNAARHVNLDSGVVFAAALAEKGNTTEPPTRFTFSPPAPDLAPLQTDNTTIQPLDVEKLSQIVSEGGLLYGHITQFTPRPQQIEMVKAIAEAFNNKRHLLIEAGTGTGKSLGYLIPAIYWAVTNNKRVVISTNTINLQDQLTQNDIPLLKKALDVDFNAAVMKGRSNYLCPRRLETARRRLPGSEDEVKTLAKVLVWLTDHQTGDRNEISLRGSAEYAIWERLSAQDEDCSLMRCETTMGGICPFYKARKAAESAHLVIINHALLVSDTRSENRVLPDYHYAIIDEAHQLEDAITNGMSFRIDRATLLRRMNDLGSANSGLLGEILKQVRSHAPDKRAIKLEQGIQVIGQAAADTIVHINRLFSYLQRLIEEIQQNQNSDGYRSIRIEHRHRDMTVFARIQESWKRLDTFFEVISDAMQQLTTALNRLHEYDIPALPDLISGTETVARYLKEIRSQLEQALVNNPDNIVLWLTVPMASDEPTLNCAPIHIGTILEQHIWNKKDSVVLTSATLRTQDSFDYIRERLYAESITVRELGSPFNYRDSTLVYLPNNIPEPNQRDEYQKAVERAIITLATALEGRVLALFTSYSQLRQTAQAIEPLLALGDITVYNQSDGSSRQSLLEGFKSTQKAVLLGTRSFWEGVDIPGDSLSALVITRLPFAVPSDPIFASRSETYANGFNQYALPEAILRFRQGFGRLIRRSTDRGIVVILDKRVTTKAYGSYFLSALPDCTIQEGSLNDLPSTAQKWLNMV